MMSKSKEELNVLKEKVENVNNKLQELTPEELKQVNGGVSVKYKDAYIAGAATVAMDVAVDRQVSRLADASSAASICR